MKSGKLKKYLQNTLLMLFSVYISAFIAEMYLEKRFDSRDKLQVVRDFNDSGKETYPLIYPANLLSEASETDGLLPLGTISHSNAVNCNESGYWATFQSDRYGFNNSDENYGSEVTFLIIGDSFAQGACVRQNKTPASLLSAEGRNSITISGGSSGPLLELAMLREYIGTVKPQYVLWFYYEHNDLSNLEREFNSKILNRYLEDDKFTQSLPARQQEIDAYLKNYVKKEIQNEENKEAGQPSPDDGIKQRFMLMNLSSLIKNLTNPEKQEPNKEPKTEISPDALTEKLNKLGKVIKQADKTAAEHNAKLIFIYLPSWERYALQPGENKRLYEDMKDDVIGIVKQNKIEVLDFDTALSKEKNRLNFFPFGKRGHYNEDGYALLNQFILDNMKNR